MINVGKDTSPMDAVENPSIQKTTETKETSM